MKDKRQKDQVGVRALRQGLSQHLARVKNGARLEITEHGRGVALLVPIPASDSWLERMVSEGRATAPKSGRLELPQPIPLPPGWRPLSEILDEMREDRI